VGPAYSNPEDFRGVPQKLLSLSERTPQPSSREASKRWEKLSEDI